MDSNGVASHEDHWCKFTKDKINDKLQGKKYSAPCIKCQKKPPLESAK